MDKENKESGLLLNVTGNGKGKSTSSFGIVIRALGWNWNVALLQFVKGGMQTGEKQFFESLKLPNFLYDQLGAGVSWNPGNHEELAREGWKKAEQLLQSDRFDLLVFDELNIALWKKWLDLDTVLNALKNRRPTLNVVVTGRYAPPELLEISDLVSEIQEIKHPYQRGIPARPGIDY